jgi:hypothetical protein
VPFTGAAIAGRKALCDKFAEFLQGNEMKRALAAAVLTLALAHSQASKEQNRTGIVLPSPKLLQCRSSACSRLWSEEPEPGAILPKQILIDMNQNRVYGFMVLYDKSVPADAIQAAVNDPYKNWALAEFANSPVNIWRAEPEKMAIPLSVVDKQDEKSNVAEAGTKQVIFSPIGGSSARS